MNGLESLEPRVVLSASSFGPETISFTWQGYESTRVADQWIVRVADSDTAWDSLAQGLSDNYGVSDVGVRQLGRSRFGVLNAPFNDADSIEQWVASSSNIAYVIPDTWRSATTTATPNDSQFGDLWGLHNTGQSGGTVDADIDGPEAWDISTGSSGVVIGVIDAGTQITHVDLAANIWQNPGEVGGLAGVDDDNNGYIDDFNGWDFVDNDNDPTGDDHGTHTAGTIGAVGNNSTGVVGVNWNVSLMALRGLGGSTSVLIEAIEYANSMKKDHGINVVATNNSWSSSDPSEYRGIQDAISDANDEDILFIASAGNGAANNDGDFPLFPASFPYDNVISVASTDRFDNLSGFSNYGLKSVHLAAPGSSILSTVNGNGYNTLSGTSMSTPQVTGVAALIAAADPTATAAEIKAAIMDGVDEIPALTNKTTSGGRLNARGALDVALSGRIAGTLYEDANQNGTRQASEPGLAGQQVFIDADNSGGHNGGELITTTDVHGNYSFTGLSAGSYRIRQVVQGGWLQTAPAGDGSHLIALVAGEWVVDENFGSHLPGAVPGLPFNENFNDSSADNITEIHGPFNVVTTGIGAGEYATGTGFSSMEPVALFKMSDTLPSTFNYSGTVNIRTTSPLSGFVADHEALVIFDYHSVDDYKFVWITKDGFGHLLIGHRDGGFMVTDDDTYVPTGIPLDTDIPFSLDFDGNTVTVSAEGVSGSHTFGDPLNDGDVGLGNLQSYVVFDDITVGGLLGDMNGDGLLNMGDMPLVIQALVNRSGYDAAYANVNADQIGDVDRSDSFDFGDISAFVALFNSQPVDPIVTATADTWVRESSPTTVYDNNNIGVWNSNSNDGQRRWGVVEFDVSGRQIESLSLELWAAEFGFSDDAVPLKQSAAIIDISSTGKATENLNWNDVFGLAQTPLETLGKYDIPAPNSDPSVPEYKTSTASAADIAAVQTIADGSGQLVLLLMADEEIGVNYSGNWSDMESSFGGSSPRLNVIEPSPIVAATADTWVRESSPTTAYDNDGISVWNSNSNDGQRRWGVVEFDVSGRQIESLSLNLWAAEFGFSDDAVPLKQSAAIVDISSTGKTTENLNWNDVFGLAQTPLETLGKYDILAPDSDPNAPEYKTSTASVADIAAVQTIADGSGQLVLLLMADEEIGVNYSGTWADMETTYGGVSPTLNVIEPASGAATASGAPVSAAALAAVDAAVSSETAASAPLVVRESVEETPARAAAYAVLAWNEDRDSLLLALEDQRNADHVADIESGLFGGSAREVDPSDHDGAEWDEALLALLDGELTAIES